MIHWELLKRTDDGYIVVESADTEEHNPNLPKFKKKGDIILGHKYEGSEIEAYPYE